MNDPATDRPATDRPATDRPATDRYAFGANWQDYLTRTFSEERVGIAGQWLLTFLALDTLKGRTFLDVGCGSGLHALAALRLGADRVVSFDYDPASVAATRSLHEYAGRPDHWQVLEGSVLDDTFMAGLGRFDVVYSWGVLHHTGDQWLGLAHTAARLSERGRLYLALYAREHCLDPEDCLALKRRYNRAGPFGRARMEAGHIWNTVCRRRLATLLRLPALARAYQQNRGMAILSDARDWLGGWPMAFSTVSQVYEALAARSLVMVRCKTGQANTEYLFMTEAEASAARLPVLRPDDMAVVRLKPLTSVRDLPGEHPYFIFGTAQGAELLLAAARNAGRPPAGFIDLTREGFLKGLPVTPWEVFVATQPAHSLIVLSNAYVQENAERLWAHGFTNLLNAHPLVVALAGGRVS